MPTDLSAKRMHHSSKLFLILAAMLLACGGCSQQISSSEVATAQGGLDQARELVSQGDFAAALPLVDAAVNGAGLNPDQYVEAVLLRVRCHAETGELEKAEADLALAEQGAADEALLHFTRGIVLSKQGKTKESKREFAIAKRLDPTLTIPN